MIPRPANHVFHPAWWSAAVLAAISASPASGGERRATFQVDAAIVTGCIVVTDARGRWGSIDLGTASGVGATTVSGDLASGGAAGVTISCTPGTRAALVADLGDHAVGGQRRLVRDGGGASLPYILRAGSTGAAWAAQSLALAFPVGSGSQRVPVAAQATIDTPLPAGTYTDTIRLTLSF